MTYLKEFIEVASDNICILEGNEKEDILDKFSEIVPVTRWARVDWDKFKSKKIIKGIDELKQIDENREFYIIWGEYDTPIIKAKYGEILKNLDIVSVVSFDTFLFSEDGGMVIEFYHDDTVTLGMLSDVI